MGIKISIITINLNNISGLKKTVDSVLSEKKNYPDLEYIVIDGMSTDGSAEYLSSNSQWFDILVVEKDSGLFNAMNKGLFKATGDYLLFLNSGDFLVSGILQRIFCHSHHEDILYGDTYLVYPNGTMKPYHHPKNLTLLYFLHHSICHQATFIKRELHLKHPYNEEYKLFSDWEFFLKRIIIENASVCHVGEVVCYFDMSGISANSDTNPIMQREKKQVFDGLNIDRILPDYETLSLLYKNRMLKYFDKNKNTKWRLYILKKMMSLLFSRL